MSEQELTVTETVQTEEKKPLVEVKDLSVHFPITGGMPFAKKKSVKAVSDMTLSIANSMAAFLKCGSFLPIIPGCTVIVFALIFSAYSPH